MSSIIRIVKNCIHLFILAMVAHYIISPAEICAAGGAGVFDRNGEVYVMIGSGSRMGVYANQKIDSAGNRVIIKPDGVRLFPAPERIEAMNDYMALAVDQFRNIYVLAGKCDPGLIDPPANFYWPVDPPKNEGVVGVGTNLSGKEFHDVLNYIPDSPQSAHGRPDPAIVKTKANFSCYYDGGLDRGPAPAPPDDILRQYMAKYSAVDRRQFRRIDNSWYPGFYPAWNNHSRVYFSKDNQWGDGIGGGNWQRRWGFKIQRVNLWISHFVQSVPAGVILPPYITPGTENPTLEEVFKTTNLQFTFQRASACAETSHAGSKDPTKDDVTTNYKLGFAATGAGRRYVYSSLPDPVIKRGSIQLVAGNTYGIPLVDSSVYTGAKGYGGAPPAPSNILSKDVCKIGAATKNPTEDWVYAAPVTEGGYDVIDFCVADQWDGEGGVTFRLLQQRGDPNRLFNSDLSKKVKWNKFNGYTAITADPANIKAGEMSLPNDAKCIAADGGGTLYYLTEARPVIDGSSEKGLTYDFFDRTKRVSKPVECPPEEGQKIWKWWRQYQVRAVSELYQIEYYTKKSSAINEFTVGSENVIVMEIFGDADGANLLKRGIPEVEGPRVKDIKLGLAVINLAGPPVGNNEKSCVDIYSTISSGRNQKEITYTRRAPDGSIAQNKVTGDETAEDEQYQCVMENAPPEFSKDFICKNINSGSKLADLNANGVIGGFLYSLRPATACYYWKVEMLEPMQKNIMPDTSFTSAVNSDRSVNLKAASEPAGWRDLPGKGARSNQVNIGDGTWYCSLGSNASLKPADEKMDAAEAPPDFAFTPKEPGVYKISLIACAKVWDYEKMPYPSYITDRQNYKSAAFKYLFFDDGGTPGSGGIKGNGIKDGDEDYLAERYIVVEAQKPQPDKYITNIKIEGPSSVDENKVCLFSASALLRFVKSFNHEAGNPSHKELMETYNGIGVWDYEPAAVASSEGARSWGLLPYDNIGENYFKGAAAKPPNCYAGQGGTGTLEVKLRNFGEIPPDGLVIQPPPYINAAGARVWGTSPGTALWIEGVGTTSNPSQKLNRADRGCIEYEWYIAGESIDEGNVKAVGTEIFDGRAYPSILIAKGRLSDEMPFPQNFKDMPSKNAVNWDNYGNSDRRFKVTLNLRYAFDMPLAPGRYFLYIKFKYPKLKWEGRSPKKTDSGAENIFAYYDLVPDGAGETIYTLDNWASVTSVSDPAGFAVTVNDKQPPQAFFTTGDSSRDPDPAKPVERGCLPQTGVAFKGGSTGDPFPFDIDYTVCDNNPNQAIPQAFIKARLGANASALAWKNVSVTKTSDASTAFNRDNLKIALETTIAPAPAAKKPGQVQDAVEIPVDAYPGYGSAGPYRRAVYKLDAPYPNMMRSGPFGEGDIPYDMTGSLPMYVAGRDAAGNVIGNTKCRAEQDTAEVESKLGRTDDGSSIYRQQYSNAPAYISVKDNDPPTVVFRALRPRENVYREYKIRQSGAVIDSSTGRASDDPCYHDVLDADDGSYSGRLRFTSYGSGSISADDYNIDGTPASISGQRSPLLPETSVTNDGVRCRMLDKNFTGDSDFGCGLVEGRPGYIIKFASKNVGLCNQYDDYNPACVSFYNFEKLLESSGSDTLEMVENSRTRFEISAIDNVDGKIQPALYTSGPSMSGYNAYVDTDNLGDALSFREVLSNWKLNNKKNLEAYGIFRKATPPGGPKPFLMIIVKDSAGNAVAAKIPIIILHTYMERNVLNTETRRSE